MRGEFIRLLAWQPKTQNGGMYCLPPERCNEQTQDRADGEGTDADTQREEGWCVYLYLCEFGQPAAARR